MQSHYNLHVCGENIARIEQECGYIFDFVVYLRPDLIFFDDVILRDSYTKIEAAIWNKRPKCIDHFSVVPRKFVKHFFLDRFLAYTSDTGKTFSCAEDIFTSTIRSHLKLDKKIKYNIVRQENGKYFIVAGRKKKVIWI